MQALITQLTRLVERLQPDVDQLPRPDRAGSLGVRPHDVASGSQSAAAIRFALEIEPTKTEIDDECDPSGRDTRAAVATPRFRGAHGVHFSRSDDHAVAAIVDMIDDARAKGRATVVVATGEHRQWIEADLHQRCIAFDGDVCRLLDAETTLSSILVDGRPDRDRFRSIIGTLLSTVCARNPGGVSVYGEMVGVLWSQGMTIAAMRLEELWNELQCELPFSLLCGYPIDCSTDSTDLDPIRHAHTYVG